VLDDGTSIPADIVLVGIGAVPNTELADECRSEL
jgi:NADPH-dependent 2,4-dienoyl-CoA reductase/sulfur reductase-like enzyme